MEVEINMINVEDGDAIILTMKRDTGEKALVVIDGGFNKYYKSRVKRRLEELLEEFPRINLLVCTHYDNDHLSGTENIINDYSGLIDEIWIHKANGELQNKINELNSDIEKLELSYSQLLTEEYSPHSFRLKIIIEDYKKLVKVLQIIIDKGLEDKVVEATTETELEGFPELKVISPTPDFYNNNLDALGSDQLLVEHARNFDNRNYIKESFNLTDPRLYREWIKLQKPCENLELSSIANGVTATNMISIVLLLDVNDNKYLFTGDAGIETFEENIPDWEAQLDKLFWLDLPHHGSKNNTSKNMLNVFNPDIVFVSGSGKSNRPSQYIKSCLTLNGSKVEITNIPENKNTWYLQLTPENEIQRIPD